MAKGIKKKTVTKPQSAEPVLDEKRGQETEQLVPIEEPTPLDEPVPEKAWHEIGVCRMFEEESVLGEDIRTSTIIARTQDDDWMLPIALVAQGMSQNLIECSDDEKQRLKEILVAAYGGARIRLFIGYTDKGGLFLDPVTTVIEERRSALSPTIRDLLPSEAAAMMADGKVECEDEEVCDSFIDLLIKKEQVSQATPPNAAGVDMEVDSESAQNNAFTDEYKENTNEGKRIVAAGNAFPDNVRRELKKALMALKIGCLNDIEPTPMVDGEMVSWVKQNGYWTVAVRTEMNDEMETTMITVSSKDITIVVANAGTPNGADELLRDAAKELDISV